MHTAKVFANGRSQAVRLPKAFRFAAKEVSVRREGEAVVLEPIKGRAWPRDFWRKIRITDRSFVRAPQGVAASGRSWMRNEIPA
ncbi:MAG: AbrB/MazE/SpoVT family DNA-binding domain-containing protein [Opitutus sp.]|nr:AbrB/MazE/SpoVT family DNA-binding domain-containing protein [Opitutus sp.]